MVETISSVDDKREIYDKKYKFSLKIVKNILLGHFRQFLSSKFKNFDSKFEVSVEFLNLDFDKWEADTRTTSKLFTSIQCY